MKHLAFVETSGDSTTVEGPVRCDRCRHWAIEPTPSEWGYGERRECEATMGQPYAPAAEFAPYTPPGWGCASFDAKEGT